MRDAGLGIPLITEDDDLLPIPQLVGRFNRVTFSTLSAA